MNVLFLFKKILWIVENYYIGRTLGVKMLKTFLPPKSLAICGSADYGEISRKKKCLKSLVES